MSKPRTSALVLLAFAVVSPVLASCGFLSVGDDQVEQARTACKQAVIPLAGGPAVALPRSLELTKKGGEWVGSGTLSVTATSSAATPQTRSYKCAVSKKDGTFNATITDLSR